VTGAEWLACDDPEEMLDSLRGKASDRRLRLFAAACCRRVLGRPSVERCRKAVEAAERFADGAASRQELDGAAAAAVTEASLQNLPSATRAVRSAAHPDAARAATNAARVAEDARACKATLGKALWWADEAERGARRSERIRQCDLLRDLFGPSPFHVVTADPSWLSWNNRAVVKLAQAAYDERSLPSGEMEPARLAVLADALEEVGCSEPALLAHCRSGGPHVRGCWVVDALLGKG
jgi:hypothetical protein